MKLSSFTPAGLLKMVAGQPAARRIYDSMMELLANDRYGLSAKVGGLADTTSFAAARMIAVVARRVERAQEQGLAATVYEMLAPTEEEYKLVPKADATVAERRAELAKRKRLPLGAARGDLEAALSELLGDDYVGIHIYRPGEVAMWPAALGDQPMNLPVPEVVRKTIQITYPISINLGTEVYVMYTALDPAPGDGDGAINIGDVLVVDPGNTGRAERVTVLDVQVANPGNITLLQAVFENPHDANTIATTQPYPMWTSSQREIVVVVKTDAAIDAETRRKVHELLDRTVTCVTTWALVQESDLFAAGPFTLDDATLGMLDVNPLGEVTVP